MIWILASVSLVLFDHPCLGWSYLPWVEVLMLRLLHTHYFMNQVLTNFVAKQIHLEIGISTMCSLNCCSSFPTCEHVWKLWIHFKQEALERLSIHLEAGMCATRGRTYLRLQRLTNGWYQACCLCDHSDWGPLFWTCSTFSIYQKIISQLQKGLQL